MPVRAASSHVRRPRAVEWPDQRLHDARRAVDARAGRARPPERGIAAACHVQQGAVSSRIGPDMHAERPCAIAVKVESPPERRRPDCSRGSTRASSLSGVADPLRVALRARRMPRRSTGSMASTGASRREIDPVRESMESPAAASAGKHEGLRRDGQRRSCRNGVNEARGRPARVGGRQPRPSHSPARRRRHGSQRR